MHASRKQHRHCSAKDADPGCSSLPAWYARVTFAAGTAHTLPASTSRMLPETDPAIVQELGDVAVLPYLHHVYLQCSVAGHPTIAREGRQ